MSFHLPFEVIHDTIGKGIAVDFALKENDTYIRVKFENGVADFIYPDQFCFHLQAKNPLIQKEILKEFAEIKGKIFGTESYYLTPGYCAGTKGIDVYDKYCKLFGWEPAFRGNFAQQKKMYAKSATPEGYSVWMIVHTNLCESYNETHSWFNFVSGETVKEVWFISDPELLKDCSTRVCFSRTKQGYTFQGIYQPEKIEHEMISGQMRLVRTFRRISKNYPSMEPMLQTVDLHSHLVVEQNEPQEITSVVDKCKIQAYILEKRQDTTIIVDVCSRPFQKELIGKKVGDTFLLLNGKLTYRIDKILIDG